MLQHKWLNTVAVCSPFLRELDVVCFAVVLVVVSVMAALAPDVRVWTCCVGLVAVFQVVSFACPFWLSPSRGSHGSLQGAVLGSLRTSLGLFLSLGCNFSSRGFHHSIHSVAAGGRKLTCDPGAGS